MAFSATDAAFEGFRVVRRHPMAVIFWALLYMVLFGAIFALAGGTIVSAMSTVNRLQAAGGPPSPEDLMPLMQTSMMIFTILLPLSLLGTAVLASAVSRAVLRPGESGFGYLRIGADELRVLAVTVILFFISFSVMALCWTVIGVVGLLTSGTAASGLILLVLGLASVCFYIWMMVRLSLAVPMTIGERRIAVFESFRITKGHLWPLLGMAVLAVVMCLVVSILGSIVVTPIEMLVAGGMQTIEGMDGESVMAMLQAAWPAILVGVVIQAILSALQVAIAYAPFSAAYRDITGGQPKAAVTA
ncbi:MAG: hypothetical protein ACOH1E_02795 [Brevundimonas sp.]